MGVLYHGTALTAQKLCLLALFAKGLGRGGGKMARQGRRAVRRALQVAERTARHGDSARSLPSSGRDEMALRFHCAPSRMRDDIQLRDGGNHRRAAFRLA